MKFILVLIIYIHIELKIDDNSDHMKLTIFNCHSSLGPFVLHSIFFFKLTFHDQLDDQAGLTYDVHHIESNFTILAHGLMLPVGLSCVVMPTGVTA